MTGKPIEVDQESLRELLTTIHSEAYYIAQDAIKLKDGDELVRIAKKYQKMLLRDLERYGLTLEKQ